MSYEGYPFFKVAAIREFLKSHDSNVLKKWGQNFLIDPNVVRIIVNAMPLNVLTGIDAIVEIGPGLGALTCRLVEFKKELLLFEIDPVLCNYLREADFLRNMKFSLFEGDALEKLPAIKTRKVFIFGNLPYYITSDLLVSFLKNFENLEGGIFMVQKEFAHRLCREISSFSVFSSAFGEFKILKNVRASCFYPAPKAESAVIQFFPDRISTYKKKEKIEILELLLKTFFWGKRKTLHKSLIDAPFIDESEIAASTPDFRARILDSILKSGIDARKRPEELTKKDFHRIVENFVKDRD
ncbi:MAG: 16S rRNA (adenine(1518)-N(6)/adenine(1519)-N(6))-dimethyltransferase RsmA [Leptospira sp.]|nr:16S rRNA (adenine(1518)-N(6)/adenine(1519)-N(6))-dimethyltransferase RsmA [Leptospira sp.]